ncbi:[Pyruvate dehydrogenase (acetyl-transferring)] kinase isozyme 4 [Phytophthora pseudosyringae]|uniref:Protein-serine/threonine kinase n=1 Tax=Phytophthora pseudosyringae TaxID=221518 RepID=A0A8T1W8B9_9STRA|nr:[Pyruvate dehydrogenase (acetyl-transferring)] kinase isozyme 4 [Phytophthora pseudosyringae]
MEIVRCGASPHVLSRVLTAGARHGAALLHMDAFRADFEASAMSMDEVREIAGNDPTPMSLQQMRTFADGSMKLHIVSAKFVHKELQSRYARAIMELSDLPVGLSETTSVRHAINFYRYELQSINRTKSPTNATEDLVFTEKIRYAKERGSNLVPLICYGLQELKATDLGQSALQLESVQDDIKDRLDKFFLGRIGIRMIIGHHVESLEHTGGRVHLVNTEQIVREACERAGSLCTQYCGVAPPVQIRATPSANMPFMHVESHLHHMVFELVKNAMRATVEHHRCRSQLELRGKVNGFERVMNPKSPSLGFYIPAVEDVSGVQIYPDVSKYRSGDELSPVEIVICQGSEDLTVKVSDEGGGVPRSRWNNLWHYDYSTSPLCPPIDSDNYPTYREHFSGGGYGLPMARLFARYFGGEVVFSSQEGSGSTAFIQAHRLGTNMELVPLRKRMLSSASSDLHWRRSNLQ